MAHLNIGEVLRIELDKQRLRRRVPKRDDEFRECRRATGLPLALPRCNHRIQIPALREKNVYPNPDISVSECEWPARDRRRQKPAERAQSLPRDAARRFKLLRWTSILGLLAIIVVSIPFAAILSHFMKREILDHDATLTSQFIVSIAETQSKQANMGSKVTLGQILDERADLAKLGIDAQTAGAVRRQFFDHLQFLPELLLADVVARDRTIIWSTNQSVIGNLAQSNDELEKAFTSRVRASTGYVGRSHVEEQWFLREPEKLYVENYVPLYDARGEVAAVTKIYKEPGGLLRSIDRGNILVWACTAFGAVFLYFALFWIMRRADIILDAQQQRLVETEALCVIGEMSAAVAHGIRNPLASIRSSAELALDGDLESTRKNATDIIFQIDRLGKWVRELLAFSRPLSGENGKIDLVSLVHECLPHFSTQLDKFRVSCEFVQPPAGVPPVLGERALATQAVASVIANAIEAMPDGGSLRLEFQMETLLRRVVLVVTDAGPGMSANELDLVFKPYFTTKRDGLGLGMALTKRIMERFGGAISLNSRKGEGTQVSLSFPLA
jgi:two-component system, NtrC family, sensor histidine kinase HydH